MPVMHYHPVTHRSCRRLVLQPQLPPHATCPASAWPGTLPWEDPSHHQCTAVVLCTGGAGSSPSLVLKVNQKYLFSNECMCSASPPQAGDCKHHQSQLPDGDIRAHTHHQQHHSLFHKLQKGLTRCTTLQVLHGQVTWSFKHLLQVLPSTDMICYKNKCPTSTFNVAIVYLRLHLPYCETSALGMAQITFTALPSDMENILHAEENAITIFVLSSFGRDFIAGEKRQTGV